MPTCRCALAAALAMHGQQVQVGVDQLDEEDVLRVLVHLWLGQAAVGEGETSVGMMTER